MTSKPEYTRFLPHFHPQGAIFFVTFRLYGSLPREFAKSLHDWHCKELELLPKKYPPELLDQAKYLHQRDYFLRVEEVLDKANHGPKHLINPKIANCLTTYLREFDGIWYDLLGYTLMANHVHLLMDFSVQFDEFEILKKPPYRNLDYVMFRIKGASARKANQILGRKNVHFWQPEYHNRYIRNRQHLFSALNYIKQNPVKAGIVNHWKAHPFTWIHEAFW
ncbi:MAG: transposase [Saprospiraceae bacterium]|nr:transposase [Saprospiraceae bacterium]